MDILYENNHGPVMTVRRREPRQETVRRVITAVQTTEVDSGASTQPVRDPRPAYDMYPYGNTATMDMGDFGYVNDERETFDPALRSGGMALAQTVRPEVG